MSSKLLKIKKIRSLWAIMLRRTFEVVYISIFISFMSRAMACRISSPNIIFRPSAACMNAIKSSTKLFQEDVTVVSPIIPIVLHICTQQGRVRGWRSNSKQKVFSSCICTSLNEEKSDLHFLYNKLAPMNWISSLLYSTINSLATSHASTANWKCSMYLFDYSRTPLSGEWDRLKYWRISSSLDIYYIRAG